MPAQTVIQVRRDTAANWTSANPTLASGEVGFETDTLRFKIGNGSTAWTSLSYGVAGSATTATTATNIAGGLAGSLPYQTGAGATALLAAGTAGRVLVMNGSGTAPEWAQPKLSAFAATTSAELAGVISDETGSGALVFSTSPSLTTPGIGSGGANFSGATSGTTNIRAAATASGTLTLPAETGTLATQAHVAGAYLPLAGGTLTGALALGGNNISGVGTLTATNITLTGTLDTGLSAGVVKSDGSGVLSAGAVSLTAEVSGVLPIANGGTGASSAGAALTALGAAAASHTHTSSQITDRTTAMFGAGVTNLGSLSTNTRIWIQATQPSSGMVEGDLYFYG